MKVTLLSTSDAFGGAAIAAWRLSQALRRHGTDAPLLVRDKLSNDPGVTALDHGWVTKKLARAQFAWDRARFVPYAASPSVRFAFSAANVGNDISHHPLVQQADVLHLHWVNFGFLSLSNIAQLGALGKPLVWTLHDMWAFTGGCHYSRGCQRYVTHCQQCPYLRSPGPRDLSARTFDRKLALFAALRGQLTIVTSSTWLGDLARQSTLLRDFPVHTIPIPVDGQVFAPADRTDARRALGLPTDRKLLLFGAFNAQDPRKGFGYLAQALAEIKASQSTDRSLELVIFGKADEAALQKLPFRVHYLGSVAQPARLALAYAAADAYALPALEDNLPNTVMEALACGTPVVAFAHAGLTDMVAHRQTGYLAPYQSASDLARGLSWTLWEADAAALRTAARHKAETDYGEAPVAAQYQQLYTRLTFGATTPRP